jgi:hypothetical protein
MVVRTGGSGVATGRRPSRGGPQPYWTADTRALITSAVNVGTTIVSATLETDRLGVLQQVGVVPPDAGLNAPQRPRP